MRGFPFGFLFGFLAVRIELRLGLQNRDLAAGLFDRRHRRLRGAGNFDLQSCRQLALGQDARARVPPAHQTAGLERRFIDRFAAVQTAAIDGLLQLPDIENFIFLAEDIVEPALGQTPVKRHLPAFKAFDADTGARFLTVMAAPRGLAFARGAAAAEAAFVFVGAGPIGQLVYSHDPLPSPTGSMCTRWLIFAAMPRTEGVSSSTRERCILLRPSPISVAR